MKIDKRLTGLKISNPKLDTLTRYPDIISEFIALDKDINVAYAKMIKRNYELIEVILSNHKILVEMGKLCDFTSTILHNDMSYSTYILRIGILKSPNELHGDDPTLYIRNNLIYKRMCEYSDIHHIKIHRLTVKETQIDIAARLGISTKTIRNIKHNVDYMNILNSYDDNFETAYKLVVEETKKRYREYIDVYDTLVKKGLLKAFRVYMYATINEKIMVNGDITRLNKLDIPMYIKLGKFNQLYHDFNIGLRHLQSN